MNPWPYPFWIAHRGGGSLAPENTLAAFRVGAAAGYRAFECDVKLSADGQPFLLHDASLDRTTDAHGPAATRTWDQLSRLDAGSWHGRQHAGEPLPLLGNIARYCQANGLALNIEIKPSPGQDEDTGRVVAKAAEDLWHGVEPPPLLTSFRPAALAAARAGAPEVPRALLLERLDEGWLDRARSLDCVAVVAHHAVLDAAAIAALHAAGLRAWAYTVNAEADARRLIAAGIDGLITDALDRFAPGRPVLSGPRA